MTQKEIDKQDRFIAVAKRLPQIVDLMLQYQHLNYEEVKERLTKIESHLGINDKGEENEKT